MMSRKNRREAKLCEKV